MQTPAYLLQVSTFFRARLSTPFAMVRVSGLPRTYNLRPTRQIRCLSSNGTNGDDSNVAKDDDVRPRAPAHSPFTSPELSEPSPPAPNYDELLAAFENSIDDIVVDTKDSLRLNSSIPEAKPKTQKVSAASEKHLKRLEFLSSLPHDLAVEPLRNKCPGCGSVLQSNSPERPGYVPSNVVEEDPLPDRSPSAADGETPSTLPKTQREPVCQRCFRLTHYGEIESHLRVRTKEVSRSPWAQNSLGETEEVESNSGEGVSELSPKKFRKTLERLRSTNAIIVFLVDIFDFHGTFIPFVHDIIGQKNPIVLAVNKVDLLPKNFKESRVQAWIRHECSVMGLHNPAGIHLVSSTKGTGVAELVAGAVRLAKLRRSDVYVIGAANVGKSSFINQLIRMRKGKGTGLRARSVGSRNRDRGSIGAITTSVVPGTTLDVIRIPLGGKVNLYDTPGLMMSHQLTNYLDAKELRAVLPSKTVENVTFRLGEGKAIYIGGLARLEVVSGKPFFFTCFFSPSVKVHPGRVEGGDEFVQRHVGKLLTPPFSEEGLQKLGDWTSKSFTAEGEGWKKSCVDVVLSGLGWISVTGPGRVRLRIWVPKGVGVFTREPLMPFETDVGVSKYTGSSAVNRKQMRRSAKKRKGGNAES